MLLKKLTFHEEQCIHAVKTYIVNHLNEPLTIKELARMAGMNPQKFRDGFYFLFEMHPAEYIHSTRMLTARHMLKYTGNPVKQIAGDVGYQHDNNFIRAFVKFFGEAPSSVR